MVRARRTIRLCSIVLGPAVHFIVMEQLSNVIVPGLLPQLNVSSLLRFSPINRRQSVAAAPGYGWHGPGPASTTCNNMWGESRNNVLSTKFSERRGVISGRVLLAYLTFYYDSDVESRVQTLPYDQVNYSRESLSGLNDNLNLLWYLGGRLSSTIYTIIP